MSMVKENVCFDICFCWVWIGPKICLHCVLGVNGPQDLFTLCVGCEWALRSVYTVCWMWMDLKICLHCVLSVNGLQDLFTLCVGCEWTSRSVYTVCWVWMDLKICLLCVLDVNGPQDLFTLYVSINDVMVHVLMLYFLVSSGKLKGLLSWVHSDTVYFSPYNQSIWNPYHVTWNPHHLMCYHDTMVTGSIT